MALAGSVETSSVGDFRINTVEVARSIFLRALDGESVRVSVEISDEREPSLDGFSQAFAFGEVDETIGLFWDNTMGVSLWDKFADDVAFELAAALIGRC